MDLQAAVGQVFSIAGPLAQSPKGFTRREGQIQMALEVANTIEQGGALVVEAGTGIGKTFAYLVPSLLSGKRVLLSTATKTLQDQLFSRDLPLLTAALGITARVAMLKGRSSYLCLQHLESARQDGPVWTPADQQDLAQVEAWAVRTATGDVSELPQLDERSPVRDRITSTRESCLGSQCPKAQQCHVNRARREAMACDVVVINHHLFFADWDMREASGGQLLPTVDSVVFDEAHQLNEIGVQFLGRQLGSAQLHSLGNDLATQGPRLALACADWPALVVQLDASATALCALCQSTGEQGRRVWTGDSPQGIEDPVWQAVLTAIHAALQQIDMVLRALHDSAPDMAMLALRVQSMAAELDYFSHPLQPGEVRWLEVSHQVKLVQSPLDIAHAMRSRVTGGEIESAHNPHRSWIFTSATLGYDAGFSWFLESCGLEGAKCLQVPSPFDYGAQAALYIPSDMPSPDAAGHPAAVAALAAHAAKVLGGRMLLLTTTLRAMRTIAQALRMACSAFEIEVLVQGELPKNALADRFIRGHLSGRGCILVASASFWEGVDIAGDALQLVLIDKLPFSPPDDPLVQARADQIKAKGQNAFMRFHVPQAALALKQGAGRLIRSETDRGILVVCDVRLAKKGYGRKVIAALPVMRRLESEDQFLAALEALTKPSTMDPCSA